MTNRQSCLEDTWDLEVSGLQRPNVAASLISPRRLWWPPAKSHYNIYDHSAVGYVSHAHGIALLYSVGSTYTIIITESWELHLTYVLQKYGCLVQGMNFLSLKLKLIDTF